ncbi:hypothetical protein O998_04775 [Anaplasma phagocytophilum str. Norway variant1]|uniref:Uncharacterized protein n=1 Tax=Anaplasma phagocytophilum str. Norway variant1 TaxID=1392506 RepID=A0A7H9DZQ9_ANAPH|nr:hypothetical protein [Anaplasma phagocytophilum]QLL67033.1 hypothetical protein O998_04775 [Anaplasma phagocytophilum str. Norway variant1]
MTKINGNKYAAYAEETNNKDGDGENKVAVCGATAGRANHGSQSTPQYLKDFVEKTLKGDKNWPTSTTASGKSPAAETNDNAKAVAKDLIQELTPNEKTIVAGLLAKTIEGGEVVEIRAVSTTFSMVNLGYRN